MADLYYIDDGYYDAGYFVYTADAASAQSMSVTVVCSVGKLISAQSSCSVAIVLSCLAEKTAFAQCNSSTTSTVSTVGCVVYNAVIAPVSLFTVGVIATVTSGKSIDCSSAVTVSVSAVVNRSTSITLNSIVTQSLQGARLRNTTAALSTSVTQSTSASRTVSSTVASASQFTQTTAVTRLRTATAASNNQFTQTAINRRVRFGLANPQITATQTTAARKTARTVLAFQPRFVLTCEALDLDLAAANLSAAFTLNCQASYGVRRFSSAISSAFTLGIIDKFYDTGETLFVSNVDSLLHFSELPLVDVFAAGTPTNNAAANGVTLSLTSGKFGQTIDWPSNDFSLQVRNAVNFDVRTSDFIYEVWYKHGGDIDNFGFADGRVMTLDQGAAFGSNEIGVYIYDAAAHTSNNWGLTSRQVYLNYSPNRIPAPPAGQIVDHIVQTNVWTHFLISRNGGTYYFFVNGELKNTWTQTISVNAGVPATMVLGGGGLFGYTDEWRLRKNVSRTSNFTPETQPYYPPRQIYAKVSYAIWETNASLTIGGSNRVRRVRSNLAVSATVSAIGRRNIGPITAALTSGATVTANVRKIARSAVSLQGTATTVTRNTRLRRNIVYLNSVATVSPTVRKVVGTAVNLIAGFTTSQTARKTARGRSNMVAFNTQITASVKNARGTITLETRATLNCQAIKSGELVIDCRSQATVTASFLKQPQPREYSFAWSMPAAMAVTAIKIVKPPVYIDSLFTVNATGNHNTVNTLSLIHI
jgi:hypothetical protein